ncbi:hypothetical protein Pla110_42660 [Polystyrenella longa]|uniref:Uncharacterized protein n=1 Tax=Polystyrenella longa TaxID=2528007 RepID=A0A518CTG4_9PLAN|nr:hypothetical protein [Polystyrenella longa]QDU82508.1 hypothetical protein Pla110_42660 [Polystyrenella longa]
MEISFATLASVYESLINGDISREEASDWAYKLDHDRSEGVHTTSAMVNSQDFYAAISFLCAADMKNSPIEYTYSLQEFFEYYQEHIKPNF